MVGVSKKKNSALSDILFEVACDKTISLGYLPRA